MFLSSLRKCPSAPDHMLVARVIQEAFPLYHARISGVRQGPTVLSSVAGQNSHLRCKRSWRSVSVRQSEEGD